MLRLPFTSAIKGSVQKGVSQFLGLRDLRLGFTSTIKRSRADSINQIHVLRILRWRVLGIGGGDGDDNHDDIY